MEFFTKMMIKMVLHVCFVNELLALATCKTWGKFGETPKMVIPSQVFVSILMVTFQELIHRLHIHEQSIHCSFDSRKQLAEMDEY